MPSKAECVAICIPPNLIPEVWPHVRGMLNEVFDRTNYGTFKDLEDAVFEARALLWVAWRQPDILCALTTDIRPAQRGKVCQIGACGGRDRKAWLHLMQSIEDYARMAGCDRIRAIGRKGWTRVLKDFRAPLVVLEKELT